MKDGRPRVHCPVCKRSIAVTFNKRNGDAYVRGHVSKPGEKCDGSNRTLSAATGERDYRLNEAAR